LNITWPADWATCSSGNAWYYSGDGVSFFNGSSTYGGTAPSATVGGFPDSVTRYFKMGDGDVIGPVSIGTGTEFIYLTKPGCAANGPTMTTNYVRCITWTNNTGVGRAYTFFQDTDPVNCGTNWVDYSAISGYVFAGAVITKCFTNRCPNLIHLYISPYTGASREEWLIPDGEIIGAATNTVNQAAQPANGQTPIGNGLGGQGFNPNVAGGGAGTNNSPTTNLVRVFNIAPTNGIPGGGATSQDIHALGDALIRAGQLDADRIIAAVNRAGTNNGTGTNDGTGAIVDAIENLNEDVNDGFAGVRADLGTNGILNRGITNGFASLSNALWGRGLGTNAYGDVSAAVGSGGSDFNSNYGSVTSSAAAFFGTGFTQGLAGSESGLLVDLALGTTYPGSALAKLDFRPSVWMSSLSVACAAIKAIAGAFCAALLYIVIWRDMEERMRGLNAASQVTGRTLVGASLIGTTVGLTVKTVISSVITVGLAGLPTAVSVFGGGGFSVSFIEIAQSAAGGSGAGTLGSKMATVWQWLGLMVPFGVILTACLNLWAWKVFAFAFETLWHIIFRLFPLFVGGLLLCSNGQAANWIVDNRLNQPVGLIAADVDGLQTQWFEPGVHRAEDLRSSFTVAYGMTPTNGMTVNAVSGYEWTRLVVGETTTNNWVAYVYTLGNHGIKWGFERGFVLSCASIIMTAIVWFSRRTLRLGFGGQSE